MMPLYRAEAVNRKDLVRGFFLFAAILVAVIIDPGCAGKDFSLIRSGIEGRGHYIEGVPFYRQEEYACGPAALASVLAFRGRRVNMEQIVSMVYLPELRGALPMDMENFARQEGLDAVSSAGTFEELRSCVRLGVPVICLLDLGFGLYKRPHYVTVLGFDDVNAVFIAHDGVKPNSLIRYAKFEKAWSRAGRWMLVVMPGSADRHHQ